MTISMSEQIGFIEETLGIDDNQLATMMTRPTDPSLIKDWRLGKSDQALPRAGDIYRVRAIYQLARSIDEAGLDQDWLNRAGEDGLSPMQMIDQGSIVRVQAAVDLVREGATGANPAELGWVD